jgi:hypothetical protein
MTTTTAVRIRYAGRDLAPGDTFTPFASRPAYTVTYGGVVDVDGVPHVILRDSNRALTRPLDSIPHDTDGPRPRNDATAYTLFTRTDAPES